MTKSYFDYVKIARENLAEDALDILVCGNTFPSTESRENPYPTKELNEYLKKHGHNSALAEENKESDTSTPHNIPEKVITMAKESNVIVLLVSNIGGVATEIPIMALTFPHKTIFCKKIGNSLSDMINGWVETSGAIQLEYTTKEDLFEKIQEELRKKKISLRLRKSLGAELNGK